MIDFLYGLDRGLLVFLNKTMASPVSDFLWPLITDYDRLLPVRIILVGVWIWMLVRGGVRGRTAALLLIPLLIIADQFSSTFLKDLFHRPRPCHVVNGVPVVADLRLLVGCGSGLAFPSSHAVNSFAVATLLGWYYRRGRPWLFGWAAIVALSRPALGVHYPSDILGGAMVGIFVGLAVAGGWTLLQQRYFPRWGVEGSL
jgi:undecaprenyl-diphosphatase